MHFLCILYHPCRTTTFLHTQRGVSKPNALPGAMAAGIASRYKTGLRLDTYYCVPP